MTKSRKSPYISGDLDLLFPIDKLLPTKTTNLYELVEAM